MHSLFTYSVFKMSYVQIEQGKLRGVVCENNEGKYLAFKGIPYAKPPIGRLRFKVSEAVNKCNSEYFFVTCIC